MFALAAHRLLPRDAEPGEIVVDRLLVFGTTARLVDVLDPQQHPPARRSRQVVVEQRGQRVAEMQMAVRARRKSENGWRHAALFVIAGRNDKGAQNAAK